LLRKENMKKLEPEVLKKLKSGGAWVPSPLALRPDKKYYDEDAQRLVALYYIRAGAKAVVPGAHTGEFAGKDFLAEKEHLELYRQWLRLTKQMTRLFGGSEMLSMCMVHGMKHAQIAAEEGYDIAVVSPRPFNGMNLKQRLDYCKKIASMIPVYGFYLQPKAGGAEITPEFWKEFFKFGYGAKFAPFDRYRTLQGLEAAARSPRLKDLVMSTGNDDHIIGDLMRTFTFSGKKISFSGGLLGHFATDTFSAVKWMNAAITWRKTGKWPLKGDIWSLADAVTLCNDALFDAAPNNFRNSIFGVKYRLYRLGLLKSPLCFSEKGSIGQAKLINSRYEGVFTGLVSDSGVMVRVLPALRKELGLRS